MSSNGISFHNLLPPECSDDYRFQVETGLYGQAIEYISGRLATGKKFVIQIKGYTEKPVQYGGIGWSMIEMDVEMQEIKE